MCHVPTLFLTKYRDIFAAHIPFRLNPKMFAPFQGSCDGGGASFGATASRRATQEARGAPRRRVVHSTALYTLNPRIKNAPRRVVHSRALYTLIPRIKNASRRVARASMRRQKYRKAPSCFCKLFLNLSIFSNLRPPDARPLNPEIAHKDTRFPFLHACVLRCTKALTEDPKQDKDEVECGCLRRAMHRIERCSHCQRGQGCNPQLSVSGIDQINPFEPRSAEPSALSPKLGIDQINPRINPFENRSAEPSAQS
jgi:hypothetical protein